ncbi:MAG TPA: Crp/Fnr family transcriptional regulator [Chitinophagaceae bacterium]|jgi:CRP-like cAMP-binding protein|nr:Crp/Fnr family transcriptional regulator [Chitinophagaceae bacterium]
MEVVKPFLEYLRKFVEISEEEFRQSIHPFITIRKYAKKQIITEAGQVENYFNFIVKGLARKYYKKGKEEINTQISYEGHIIHSQESFHSRTPSEYCIEAIEPTTFVSITYDNLEKIYALSTKMEHLGRLIITYTMVIKDRWQMQLVMHTPRERFIHFVNHNPELLQRVPQKFLASYLNIKPETFSRFKHLVREVSKNELA